MFLRLGIKAVTMDDISREAGVSKRTVYENFRDKNDLLRHCLGFMDAHYIREHEAILQQATNPIQMVFDLIKLVGSLMQQVNPLFFEDLRRYHKKVWKEVHEINTEKQKVQTLTILKKGINQGLFRKDIDLDIVTILLMHQLNLVHDLTVFPINKYSQQEVFENVIINFFRGIATQKGVEIIDKILNDKAAFLYSRKEQ